MKHVYFNELTLAGTDVDNVRHLVDFLKDWKSLSSSLAVGNNLYVLPEVTRRLWNAITRVRKAGMLCEQSLASLLVGTFHSKRLPIDDEPDTVAGSQDRFCASTWSIKTENERTVSCPMLAWSHLQGSLTVGFDASGIWKKPIVRFVETTLDDSAIPRTAVCVSRTGHLSDPIVRRWMFCFSKAENKLDNPGFIYAEQGHKHFKLASMSEDRTTENDWVDSTRPPGAALFRPGLHETSQIIADLIRMALSRAFESGCYTADEQNRFEVNTNQIIGAASGKRTSKIKLYMTAQNELHIRPKE